MKNKINVLHVFGSLNRGGAETLIMDVYRRINKNRFSFNFIKHTSALGEYEKEILELGGKIITVPRFRIINYISYTNKWKKILYGCPLNTIVHGHMRSTASIYLKIAKIAKLKTIAHSHSTSSRGNIIEKSIKNIMQKKIPNYSDMMIACSDASGWWLFGDSIKKENYIKIHNGIDTRLFMFDYKKREIIRSKLKIDNKLVIGHVGSFTPPKNQSFIIDIINEIQKYKEDVVLLLIGDGYMFNRIQEKVYNLGLKDKVIFIGSVDNVYDYLSAMDIFVFPSIFEGLGISLIEAQASGLKCYISNTLPHEVDITDLIRRVDLRSSAEIWAVQILRDNDINYKRISYAEEVKKQNYDINAVVEHYERVYDNLAK